MPMENNTIVSIIEWQVDWLGIKNLCKKTINMDDTDKEPIREWKRKLLIAEHSPLRHSLITIQIDNIPYAMAMHFVRHHVGVTPYVGTSRTDRTGVDRTTRSQMDPVSMRMDLNIQSLIQISRKRLCNEADVTTQKIWLEVIKKVAEYDQDIAWACVKECIRDGGCPEKFGTCEYFKNFTKDLSIEELTDIEKRYDIHAKRRSLGAVRKLK